MRQITCALTLSLLALPCAAQDSWTLDGKHVLAARPSGSDEAQARAANKELAPWLREQMAAAKSPRVFVVCPDSAATLVADLGKAGHTLVARKGDLRALSPKHAAVYTALANFQRLTNLAGLDFKARRKAQDKATKRLLSRKGMATPIRDVLLLSKSKREQLFLAAALGDIPPTPGHEAILALPDIAIVTTLARALPRNAKSLALLQRAYPRQSETNGKNVILREISKRTGRKADAAFLRAVATDADAAPTLRAEAVTALGRRKDPKDFAVLAEIAKTGDLVLRQRAIVGAASSDGVKAIPLLKTLSQDPNLRIRATTVLALGRIGSDAAIKELKRIAKDDAKDAIRTRAQRLLAALKRKKQEKQEREEKQKK
ncbi:MAG: HEAT repeat domain-containing protein [Planctomycetes bacterium]|nr:HEAT repeat domain-containing protein [Planctomycetota bacterium]